MAILPFLFSAIEREWNKLPEKTKEVMIQSGQFGQLLKQYYKSGYDEFLKVIEKELGLSKETTDEMLRGLAKKMGWDIDAPAELFDRLQEKIDSILEDSTWDNLWTSIAGQLHLLFTEGRVNWGQLMMGLVQFVYEKFIKPATN